MAFPNFFGRRFESANNFLDDLEMAFLVSGRDGEEVKLRAFPLVLREEAKLWFQNLEPGRKTVMDDLKEAFLFKYGGGENPEEIWRRISSLQQDLLGSYSAYEAQFLRLWVKWEASLQEGERAPNFLQKEKFLAGLSPALQEKVKGKFPDSFEEAMQWARLKDRKLQLQAHASRMEPPHPTNTVIFNEQPPPAPPATPEDPHLELLQRVTNQLDNLSINLVQGPRVQSQPPNAERGRNAPPTLSQQQPWQPYCIHNNNDAANLSHTQQQP